MLLKEKVDSVINNYSFKLQKVLKIRSDKNFNPIRLFDHNGKIGIVDLFTRNYYFIDLDSGDLKVASEFINPYTGASNNEHRYSVISYPECEAHHLQKEDTGKTIYEGTGKTIPLIHNNILYCTEYKDSKSSLILIDLSNYSTMRIDTGINKEVFPIACNNDGCWISSKNQLYFYNVENKKIIQYDLDSLNENFDINTSGVIFDNHLWFINYSDKNIYKLKFSPHEHSFQILQKIKCDGISEASLITTLKNRLILFDKKNSKIYSIQNNSLEFDSYENWPNVKQLCQETSFNEYYLDHQGQGNKYRLLLLKTSENETIYKAPIVKSVCCDEKTCCFIENNKSDKEMIYVYDSQTKQIKTLNIPIGNKYLLGFQNHFYWFSDNVNLLKYKDNNPIFRISLDMIELGFDLIRKVVISENKLYIYNKNSNSLYVFSI